MHELVDVAGTLGIGLATFLWFAIGGFWGCAAAGVLVALSLLVFGR